MNEINVKHLGINSGFKAKEFVWKKHCSFLLFPYVCVLKNLSVVALNLNLPYQDNLWVTMDEDLLGKITFNLAFKKSFWINLKSLALIYLVQCNQCRAWHTYSENPLCKKDISFLLMLAEGSLRILFCTSAGNLRVQ